MELKKITQEQFNSAIEDFRQRPSEPFSRALERLSLATQKQIAELIAEHFGLALVDLTPAHQPPLALKRFSQIRARNYGAIPFRESANSLTIAVADPTRYTHEEAAVDFPRTVINFVVAPRSDILAAIELAYSPPVAVTNPAELFQTTLNDAVVKRASDVHIEMFPNAVAIRFRIDNQLILQRYLAPEMKPAIIQAAKTFARLDLAQRNLPQDGQGTFTAGSATYHCRISVIPTIRGENACIRIQNQARHFGDLPGLGLTPELIDRFVKLISVPNGLFYFTGPTGSGKTTLQYALLATQDLSAEKVCTAEDPVEYELPNYMQSQIDEKVGRTFSVLLRAFMRHDPDVILIGETRDEESAKTAINAALTGHRVFSTLHTNDAAGTVARLGEFGIEPFLISSAVKGVCATRLVQRLCMSCRQKPNPATHEFLTKEYGEGDYYEPQGCPKCAGTGFLGRLAILEVFPLSDDSDPVTQKLILERAPMAELKRHLAGKYGSMRLDGIAKARRGITTIQEVLSQV